MEIERAQRTQSGTILVTLPDGRVLTVPDDLRNRHRRAVQRWSDAGGRVEPAPPPEPPPPSVPSLVERLIAALVRKGVLEPGEIERR